MPKCQPSKLANVSTAASSPTCGTAGMSNRFLFGILAFWHFGRLAGGAVANLPKCQPTSLLDKQVGVIYCFSILINN
jgi:hypothetical protein